MYHQKRVDQTYHDVFGIPSELNLELSLAGEELSEFGDRDAKARIVYDRSGQQRMLLSAYTPLHIDRLQVIPLVDEEYYPYKSTDREWIDSYTSQLPQGTDALFVRDGLVRESSYTNLAMLVNGRWYTPSEPLHRGTTLDRFVGLGHLIPSDIRLEDMRECEEIRLFNALLGWGGAHRLRYTDIVT